MNAPCPCCGKVDWLAWPLVDGGLDHMCLTCGEFLSGPEAGTLPPPAAHATLPCAPPEGCEVSP